jgi:hypothetical protein
MGTSASDYKARYDQLRVFGSGGNSTTVSVHQYLMSGTGGMPGGGSATAWAALSQALNTKFGSGHSAKKIEDVDLMVGPLHDLEAVDPDFTATSGTAGGSPARRGHGPTTASRTPTAPTRRRWSSSSSTATSRGGFRSGAT